MFVFKHPKYYTELRKRNKSDQAISLTLADGCNGSVRPGPGHKQRDSQVVNQVKLSSQSQASGHKPQATSAKHQASSVKSQAPEETSDKHQAPSSKHQV